MDNLTGHNEELRKELKDSRLEATRAVVEVDRTKAKVSPVFNVSRKIEIYLMV